MIATGHMGNYTQGEQHIHEYSQYQHKLDYHLYTYAYLCIKCPVIISNHAHFKILGNKMKENIFDTLQPWLITLDKTILDG